MLDRSDEDLGIGQIKLVFQLLGKMPRECDKLNRQCKGEEMTNLHFLMNMFGIKSGPGLELELNEPSDSNTSNKSIEQERSEEERTLDGFCCL